jgi:hypothetical protein
MRRPLTALLAGLVGVAVVAAIGLTWQDKSDAICRENAPAAGGGYSVRWEWEEFAYVCDYRVPEAEPRRVGIVDAFHGEGGRGHRP